MRIRNRIIQEGNKSARNAPRRSLSQIASLLCLHRTHRELWVLDSCIVVFQWEQGRRKLGSGCRRTRHPNGVQQHIPPLIYWRGRCTVDPRLQLLEIFVPLDSGQVIGESRCNFGGGIWSSCSLIIQPQKKKKKQGKKKRKRWTNLFFP